MGMMMLMAYAIGALFTSFLCSLMESVVLGVEAKHIARMHRERPKLGIIWSGFKKDIEKPLMGILTLNTIAHTVGALGVGKEVQEIWKTDFAFTLASVLMTLGILFLSELLPKFIGAKYTWQLIPPVTKVTQALSISLLPVTAPINWLRMKFEGDENQTLVTREELIVLSEISEEEGVLGHAEERIIQNLLNLTSTKVEDVMTPQSCNVNNQQRPENRRSGL